MLVDEENFASHWLELYIDLLVNSFLVGLTVRLHDHFFDFDLVVLLVV
jgi:hypothetical protein